MTNLRQRGTLGSQLLKITFVPRHFSARSHLADSLASWKTIALRRDKR
jgi:hypothetical protein